jgi:nucleoside-diphosphate-sugar epimerase
VIKVLITGGAGFIGQNLARKLQQMNYEVSIIDNFSRQDGTQPEDLHLSDDIRLINIDLTNKVELFSKVDLDYEYIFHLAAIVGVKNVERDSYGVLELNTKILFNTIDFAKSNKSLKRFIFFSTSEVYAGTLEYFSMKIPTSEVTPLAVSNLSSPRTSYMLSKIYGEALVIQSKLPFLILRPHNIYGPNMGFSHVIPELIRKSLLNERKSVIEVKSAKHTRSFCYIDDAIQQIISLSINNHTLDKTLNVGNQYHEISIMSLAELIFNLTEKNQKPKKSSDDKGSPLRRCPDMKSSESIIGKIEFKSLEKGIKECIDWQVNLMV